MRISDWSSDVCSSDLTPLDPLGYAAAQAEGRAQADRVVAFLRGEYPQIFGGARVRQYGFLGIRQTRWIVGGHRLTVEEVRRGVKQPVAILTSSWPIELHDRAARKSHAQGTAFPVCVYLVVWCNNKKK